MKIIKVMASVLLAALSGVSLSGCGARDKVAPPPAGMKVGQPLSAAQVQALDQKYQAHKQRQAQ